MQDCLTETERKVLEMRFFQSATLAQVADACSVTPSRAQRIEGESLKSLRRERLLKSYMSEYADSKVYSFTSFTSFKYNLASSEELIIEKLENIQNQNKGENNNATQLQGQTIG